MKKYLGVLFFVFATNLTFAQLPDFEVKDIDQNWKSLNEMGGEKYTVIDFWATWCKPCVSSIPKLNSIYSEFSDQGIEFIGINTDGPRNQAKVKPFVNSLNIKYPIVLDPDQELVDEYNVTSYPTLIVLNKKGKEVFVHEGFTPGDEDLIRKELTKLLTNETEN